LWVFRDGQLIQVVDSAGTPAVLIDTKGGVRASMPEGAWKWPLGSEWLIQRDAPDYDSLPAVPGSSAPP
jgi:hypothetical protein